MRRVVGFFGAVLAFTSVDGPPAAAHGHGHGSHGHAHHAHHHSLFLGAVPFYAPRPVYYHPPEEVTVIAPLDVLPQPGDCRLFQGDALFRGTGQPYYGAACFGSDLRWHAAR